MTTDTSTTTGQARHHAITGASILCYIMAVGWSIGPPQTISYMIRNSALRVIDSSFGQFRGMSAPFEALGLDAAEKHRKWDDPGGMKWPGKTFWYPSNRSF